MLGGPALSPTVPDAKSAAETRVMHQPADQFNTNAESYPPLVNKRVDNTSLSAQQLVTATIECNAKSFHSLSTTP